MIGEVLSRPSLSNVLMGAAVLSLAYPNNLNHEQFIAVRIPYCHATSGWEPSPFKGLTAKVHCDPGIPEESLDDPGFIDDAPNTVKARCYMEVDPEAPRSLDGLVHRFRAFCKFLPIRKVPVPVPVNPPTRPRFITM